jgi:hypothetical protein
MRYAGRGAIALNAPFLLGLAVKLFFDLPKAQCEEALAPRVIERGSPAACWGASEGGLEEGYSALA